MPSVAASAAASAAELSPWRRRYAAEASTTTATSIATTTAKPMISGVTEPRSVARLHGRASRKVPYGTSCSESTRMLGAFEPSTAGISGSATLGVDLRAHHRARRQAVARIGPAGDPDAGHGVEPLVAVGEPHGLARTGIAGRLVGCRHEGTPGGAGGRGGGVGRALGVEGGEHDVEQRHDQQDRQPDELDDRGAGLVAASSRPSGWSRPGSRRVSSTPWPVTARSTAGPQRPSAGTDARTSPRRSARRPPSRGGPTRRRRTARRSHRRSACACGRHRPPVTGRRWRR